MIRRPSRPGCSPGRHLGAVKSTGEKLSEAHGRGRHATINQQVGSAMLDQHLSAAPAGSKRPPVPGGHADGHDPAMPARDHGRDEPAFSAQGEPERGVLDVAPGDDATVLAKRGGANSKSRVGRVRVSSDLVGGLTERCPIGGSTGLSGWQRVSSVGHRPDTTN